MMLKIFTILLIIFTLSTQKPINNNDDNKDEFNSKIGRPRCQHPEAYLNALTGVDKKPWGKKNLKYYIKKNKYLSIDEIRKATDSAIQKWTNNIDLTISETFNKKVADIIINFKRIDGPSNVLAYAYYPEIGDMYFDNTETWTLNDSISYNVYSFNWVMIHEMGHSLGLIHDQSDQTSIMYPLYSASISNPNPNDLKRISLLYGPKNSISLDNSILCADSSFDLMFTTYTGEHVIMKDSMYWTFNENGLQSGPDRIEKMFPNIPETKFDAILSGNSKKTILFKKNYYYIYDNENPTSKLTKHYLTHITENINCGFKTEQNILYMFMGSKFYVVNPYKTSLDGNFREMSGTSINQTFTNVPNDIENCFYTNNRIYFIKKNVFYMISMDKKELMQSGDVEDQIFKCYD